MTGPKNDSPSGGWNVMIGVPTSRPVRVSAISDSASSSSSHDVVVECVGEVGRQARRARAPRDVVGGAQALARDRHLGRGPSRLCP